MNGANCKSIETSVVLHIINYQSSFFSKTHSSAVRLMLCIVTDDWQTEAVSKKSEVLSKIEPFSQNI